MGDSNSIINLGELSKPATVLVEKISDAIGGLVRPWQIKRVAEAEAEAEKIHAVAQIEITKLQKRAVARFIAEETRKQQNIEAITAKALPELETDARPENLENDWIADFFDKCRLVSDEEMQMLWARTLAGEANSPGKFSKRTVSLLASMDKSDASMFSTICCFAVTIPPLTPIIYGYTREIYSQHGIRFTLLTHLESIGLIRLNLDSTHLLTIDSLEENTVADYFGRKVLIKFSETKKMCKRNELAIGQAVFTQAGEQLAGICGAKPLDGFFEFLKESWAGYAVPRAEKFGPPQF